MAQARPLASITILQAKERLHELAVAIEAQPEFEIDSMDFIHEFCSHQNPNIVKLALGTELSVFINLIPGYRMRDEEEQDGKVQLSEGVKQLRKYEKKFLTAYQRFLKFLESSLRHDNLKLPACHALSTLFSTHPHFNFFINLIKVVIPLFCEPTYCDIVTKHVEKLFQNDTEQYSTLAVLEFMKNFAEREIEKKRIPQEFFTVLLSVSVKEPPKHELDDDKLKQQVHVNVKAKDKKSKASVEQMKEKVERDVLREMEESRVAQSATERKRVSTKTLSALIRIASIALDANVQRLFIPSLTLLAKLTPHLNTALVSDLLIHVRDIVLPPPTPTIPSAAARSVLPASVATHPSLAPPHTFIPINPSSIFQDTSRIDLETLCSLLNSAFHIISLHADTLNVDNTALTRAIYTIILHVSLHQHLSPSSSIAAALTSSGHTSHTLSEMVALSSLQTAFFSLLDTLTKISTGFQQNRAKAFIQRLLSAAVFSDEQDAVALVQTARRILIVCPSAYTLFNGEVKIVQFRPDTDNCDFCAAEGAIVWEIDALKHHYSHHVRLLVEFMLSPTSKQAQPTISVLPSLIFAKMTQESPAQSNTVQPVKKTKRQTHFSADEPIHEQKKGGMAKGATSPTIEIALKKGKVHPLYYKMQTVSRGITLPP
ncbi:putative Nucleolar complex-associated protein 3 [Blattamonas nauphoetae]|uniref:Nucleolar complex-associated protein 3 n=1 Tax=Blattamonas nauphoetae TaxID=2049346 RepID=A0ABQ9YLG0_9EUKA|nr:putative Nucleolar complex-associated protein 3 [Blattamonas nauphoetae]